MRKMLAARKTIQQAVSSNAISNVIAPIFLNILICIVCLMAITTKKLVQYKVPASEILAALLTYYGVPGTLVCQKWGMDSDGQNYTFLFEDTT